MFAAKQPPQPTPISTLHKIGIENYMKTKPIDYASVLGEKPGFGAYEDEINS